MYIYFKMLHEVCDGYYDDLSIMDLTIKLAESAGYYRDVYIFKNGNKRIRTMYKGRFDDTLTAKWLCYYENLFVSKLCKHPEFKDYHDYIINRTFLIVMNSINLDKVIADDTVNKYVNMALGNRIGEVLAIIGSNSRLGTKRLKQKTAINHMAISLESLTESESANFSYNDLNYSELVIDLKCKLSDNILGLELLDIMLQSNYKIKPNAIDQYIKCEHSEKSKSQLTDAYNIIKNTLREYLKIPKSDKRWAPIKSVKFSNEVL